MRLRKKIFWSVLVLLILLISVLLIVLNRDKDVKPELPKVYTDNQNIPVYLGYYFQKELGMLNREQFKGLVISGTLDRKKPTIIKKSENLHIKFNQKMHSKEYFEVIELKKSEDAYPQEKIIKKSFSSSTTFSAPSKKGTYKIIIRYYKDIRSADFGFLINVEE